MSIFRIGGARRALPWTETIRAQSADAAAKQARRGTPNTYWQIAKVEMTRKATGRRPNTYRITWKPAGGAQ